MKRKAPKKRYRAAKVLHARRYAPKRIESKKRRMVSAWNHALDQLGEWV